MPSQPIIAIVSNHIKDPVNPGWFYYATREQDVVALRNAGAMPVIFPSVFQSADLPDLLAHLDGIYLAGGGDVHGRHYDHNGDALIKNIFEPRDETELALARFARRQGIPILGICRGCQVLNVAAGGTLVVDIPTAQPAALPHHTHTSHDDASHDIRLEAGSRLEQIYHSLNMTVNSHHHQAVDRPGEGLRINARALDGVIEGIEDSAHPFYIGVQFHPERPKGNQPGIEVIFSALVSAAQQYRQH